jgi:hypothetical protein
VSRGGPSTVGSHWIAASLSYDVAELSTKAHEPLLKRFDEIPGSQAFNDLRLRQPVSQSLALGISYDGCRLEENGDDICSRKKKESVSPYRTSQRTPTASLEADHYQAKQELPKALPFYRISEQQVGAGTQEGQGEVGIPVQETARDDQEPVYGGSEQSPRDVGLRVRRQQAP